MSHTDFKTPTTLFKTPRSDRDQMSSDSEESIASTTSDPPGSASSNGEISLVAEFDDLMRGYRPFKTNSLKTEAIFLDFVEETKILYANYYQAIEECRRLQALVDCKIHEYSDLDHKLLTARKLLDIEKGRTRAIKKERDDLALQINHVKKLLLKEDASSTKLSSDEMRKKLSFLHDKVPIDEDSSSDNNVPFKQLSAIKEINSTGSILSDFSYSRSEDDLDTSALQAGKDWKTHRPSTGGVAEPAFKKRRSSSSKAVEIAATDTVRATTTLTLSKDGPITATSVIESIPKTPGAFETVPSNGTNSHTPSAPPVFEKRGTGKEHNFQQKTLVLPETCTACDKRIRFGKTAIKCKECRAVCHQECKNGLPLPCIPQVNTPNQRNGLGFIGDYTPTTPPMVPAILIHCINEIELRGLTEIGIYRIPGAERDVKALKERFLKGKGAPCLNQIDIHVLCGTVKDFLRTLQEPITTYGLWKKFVQAVEVNDPIDVQPALYQVISELPQPNRDTLAYIILHLQKVSQARECKMDIGNLAKVFGPTIVGYSSDNPNPNTLLDEMVQHNNVMEQLIKIPSEYWSTFINIETIYQPSRLQQTPSTDSLLRPLGSRGLFTPVSNNRNITKKRTKYFPSPKHIR